FLRDVHIGDAAVGGGKVVLQRSELITVSSQRLHVRADAGAVSGQLRDSSLDVSQGGVRAGEAADVISDRGRIGGVAEVHAGHGELVGITVGGDLQAGAIKEADAVEVLRADIGDVAGQGGKLLVVQSPVAGRLGHVLSQDCQFAHAVQGIIDLLQVTVLCLVEGHRVTHVVIGRVNPGHLGV